MTGTPSLSQLFIIKIQGSIGLTYSYIENVSLDGFRMLPSW
jgi:hypothetical protein